jgi:hypothetical protein
MRPINAWLPPTIGLLAAACVTILASARSSHLTWPRLLIASAFLILVASLTAAVATFLTYAVVPPQPDPGKTIRRTSATAACLAPLIIFLQLHSMWAPIVAAFLVWTLLPAHVDPKPQWKKFAGALAAAVLLQIGAAAWLGEESIISALTIGAAVAPILWRIRQERILRGPFQPRLTAAVALLLTILGLTYYLPGSGNSSGGAYATNPSAGKKPNAASRGLTFGGKYRGIILAPEDERHTILVVPLALMSRNPFLLHKDPIGIPFYGVYWFFQSPDKAPNEDAFRVKGSPDNVFFHSADNSVLRMEAHQNLGRLIDVKTCSRIDLAVRNADAPDSTDIFVGSLNLELVLVNTTLIGRPSQSLGRLPITSKPPSPETLSFKIPPVPAIQQFDELTIRFPRGGYRATRSAKVAIDRFYLIPR